MKADERDGDFELPSFAGAGAQVAAVLVWQDPLEGKARYAMAASGARTISYRIWLQYSQNCGKHTVNHPDHVLGSTRGIRI